MALQEQEAPRVRPEIQKFKPSQITAEKFKSLGLVELVTEGYSFEGNDLQALIRAAGEYEQKDERSDIYLAVIDGKAIGSLVTTKWTPDDDYGKKFWDDLKQRNRSLHRRLNKISPLGINVSGITTHPNYRRKGVTELIYKRIVLESRPSFVNGITKTPEAVMARAKHLGALGYRTFYGNTEVTPNKADFYTNVHQDLLDADIKARWESLEETLDGSDVYYIDGWLPRTIPDVSKFPEYIQKAFEGISNFQKMAIESGNKKVAIKALISVTNRIRLRAPEGSDDDVESSLEQIPLFDFDK